ncbi:MAG: fructose PTS transporter subunit IIA [Actinomycetota bacterium]|nr:fructose PTS transporter subunit IIA [Actinomycetota bacterium]
MSEILEASFVLLEPTVNSKSELIDAMVATLAAAGRITDREQLVKDIAAREEIMQTGLEGGIGLPHARSVGVREASVAFARVSGGVDFGAADGKADIVFLIAVPATSEADHMKIIASLARRLIHDSFKSALRSASSKEEIVEVLSREVFNKK